MFICLFFLQDEAENLHSRFSLVQIKNETLYHTTLSFPAIPLDVFLNEVPSFDEWILEVVEVVNNSLIHAKQSLL